MITQFFPIDYDYFDFEGRNYIKITGRDEKEERILKIKNNYINLRKIPVQNYSLANAAYNAYKPHKATI